MSTLKLPPEVFEQRFWAKVVKTETCWMWVGPIGTTGYGVASFGHGNHKPAHRAAYQYLVGPIPAGLQLDHLCRRPLCVNPAHLEPVTPAVNNARSTSISSRNAKKTQCKYGHLFNEENTGRDGKGRACRTCWRIRAKHYGRKKRALANGLPWTPDELYAELRSSQEVDA